MEGCQKETNLVVGGMAYLADQEANNLRLSPGSDGLRTGRIQPGERVVILDGPVCADGFVWWDVQLLDTNLVGWTAEGMIVRPGSFHCHEVMSR
jgi:hypothetical protein